MPQRGKVLDTDGPTPKFLYAMLKQLDLKSVSYSRLIENTSTHYSFRLIGTVLPPILRYRMAMPLAWDSLGFVTRWREQQGLSEQPTGRKMPKGRRLKKETWLIQDLRYHLQGWRWSQQTIHPMAIPSSANHTARSLLLVNNSRISLRCITGVNTIQPVDQASATRCIHSCHRACHILWCPAWPPPIRWHQWAHRPSIHHTPCLQISTCLTWEFSSPIFPMHQCSVGSSLSLCRIKPSPILNLSLPLHPNPILKLILTLSPNQASRLILKFRLSPRFSQNLRSHLHPLQH